MRTLAQLRQMQSDLLQSDALKNSRGADPSKTDQNDQINWAYRLLARKCYLVKETTLTLTGGVNTYNIRDTTTPIVADSIIRPAVVLLNLNGTITPLRDASRRNTGFWTYDELCHRIPSWKSAPQNPPYMAILMSTNKLLFYPTPDATTAALTGHTIYGQYMPAPLVNDADIPDLVEELAEAIAWLSAQLAATPTAGSDEAWNRLKKYSDYWTEIVEDSAEQGRENFESFGTSNPGDDNSLIYF